MKRWFVCLTVSVTLLIGFCLPSQAQDRALFRFYNSWNGQHFYTADFYEAASVGGWPWHFEGIEAMVWSDGNWNNGRIPIYRLYHPFYGDHTYTRSGAARDYYRCLGYWDEGIAFYVYPNNVVPGTFKLQFTLRDWSFWWRRDELISMRSSEIWTATDNYGYGLGYNWSDSLGYAAPGYNGVN